MRAIATITRGEVSETQTRLVCSWCDDFCEQVHQQCLMTYGSRHGFERPRAQKKDTGNN